MKLCVFHNYRCYWPCITFTSLPSHCHSSATLHYHTITLSLYCKVTLSLQLHFASQSFYYFSDSTAKSPCHFSYSSLHILSLQWLHCKVTLSFQLHFASQSCFSDSPLQSHAVTSVTLQYTYTVTSVTLGSTVTLSLHVILIPSLYPRSLLSWRREWTLWHRPWYRNVGDVDGGDGIH